jgi:hypothetical protein
MIDDGATVLYLTGSGARARAMVTDWTGKLSFVATAYSLTYGRTPRGTRYPIASARFTGPDGAAWSIVVRGDMQCGRARRLKRQPRRIA